LTLDTSGVGTMAAQYTDPTGTVWDLTDLDPDLGWFTTPGVSGWGATAYTLTVDKLPRGGVNIRAIRSEEGRLTWPLHIYSDSSHVEFVQRYRAIKQAFLMTAQRNQPGVLRVTRPDLSAREIDVIYEDGLRGEPGENWMSANPVLTLMCPDGYWRDITAIEENREYQPGVSFLAPFPQVSAGQVLGQSAINNPGDVIAWPEWTIDGPATVITAETETIGQSFILTQTIAAGETITITTKQPAVRGPVGQNLINQLNWPDAQLWGLLPGDNNVNFTVAGAGPGTKITLSFYPRYDGA
jgi:hypothetical protein